MRSDTLNLAMDYGLVMEQCAAYVAVVRPSLREPGQTANFVRPIIEAATDSNSREAFCVVLLDSKSKPIGIPRIVGIGLLDSTPIHPREVFRCAIADSAACVILAHNHPSGDPTPSKEDIDITRRLIEAARILGIQILDHLIIGKPGAEGGAGYVSLLEKNLVAFK